jgi:tetratricopeptide (TPR) repeat protein
VKSPLHFLILAIFCLCTFYSTAQVDTTLVRNLHKKAYSFVSTYPDSLLWYRDSSFHVAALIHDEFGVADSFTDLGIYHWVKGNYAAAIHAYDTSNQIFERIKRLDKRSGNFTNLGMVYSRLGDFPKATKYFLEALRMAESQNTKDFQGRIYNSLGVAYKNQGNLDEAAQAYSKALSAFIETGNRESVAGSYTNMGNIHVLRKDFATGLEFQLKALAIFDSLQNSRGLVTCYNNISDIHLAQNNLNEALTFRKKALDLSRAKGFFSNEVVALSGIGAIHTARGDYRTAERAFIDAMTLAHARNYRTEMVNIYKGLSNCYKKLGRYADALGYHERYMSLKDSLFNQQSTAAISNLQTAYDLERKEASIQLLRKDNEIATLARNRVIILSVGLLVVAVLVVMWQRSKIRKNRQLHAQQQKLHETEQALTKAELETAHLRGEELLNEIDYKNKALTTYALSMVQKNEILEEVRESVELIIRKPDNQPEHFKKLSRIIDYGFTLDKDWEDFKLYFEEVHSDFFSRLCERYSDLGGADLKLCALIRLNMNVKQSAAILRISPDSVKVARHRLRKKFNLQTEDNLTGFIMSL